MKVQRSLSTTKEKSYTGYRSVMLRKRKIKRFIFNEKSLGWPESNPIVINRIDLESFSTLFHEKNVKIVFHTEKFSAKHERELGAK